MKTFLGGKIKGEVYLEQAISVQDIKGRVIIVFAAISQWILQNQYYEFVIERFRKRVNMGKNCIIYRTLTMIMYDNHDLKRGVTLLTKKKK